jgi:transcriptional regulator with GAF, ATPase, and Fis domain
MHVLQKAIEQRRLKSENAYLRSQLEERYQFGGILGRSRPMRELFQLLETVSRSASTILITGETGTERKSSRARFITAARGAPTGSSH